MRNVAFMPEGDVFQSGNRISAQHARETGQTLPRDWISLVWHRARTFLSFRERLFRFQNFRPLQMSELDRPAFHTRADEGERRLKFRVDVALDDLRGDWRRFQSQFF